MLLDWLGSNQQSSPHIQEMDFLLQEVISLNVYALIIDLAIQIYHWQLLSLLIVLSMYAHVLMANMSKKKKWRKRNT